MTANTQRTKSARRLRILRIAGVCDMTGYSKATIHRRFGHLRIKLGPNSSGWLEHEIEAEIEALVAASRGDATTAE